MVFSGQVDARTAADPRVKELSDRLSRAEGGERAALATQLTEVRSAVRAEMLGKVAAEFDSVHRRNAALRRPRASDANLR